MNNNDQPSIIILGQTFTYPQSWPGVACILFICTALCVSLWIILVPADEEKLRHVTGAILQIRISPGGTQEVEKGNIRIGFWTPSGKTKNAFSDGIHEKDVWETLVTDDQVNEFGLQLRSHPQVSGYRRYEVQGQGKGILKDGWWWILSADKDFSVSEFAAIYRTFWNTQTEIYLEIAGAGDSGYRK